MDSERWQQVKQILDEAISVKSAERSSFFDRASAGDAELRKEVESLLSSQERVGTGFLKVPAMDLKAASVPAGAVRAGRRIGVYQIAEEIGRGGRGEIYRAVGADGQYTKEVAVKLVRGGFDTAFALERLRTVVGEQSQLRQPVSVSAKVLFTTL